MNNKILNALIENSENILTIRLNSLESNNLNVEFILDENSIPQNDIENINELILVSNDWYGPAIKFNTDIPMKNLLSKIDMLVDNNINFTLTKLKNNINFMYIHYYTNIDIVNDYIKSINMTKQLFRKEDYVINYNKPYELYKIKTSEGKEHFVLNLKNAELSTNYLESLGFYTYIVDINKYVQSNTSNVRFIISNDKIENDIVFMLLYGLMNIKDYKNKEYKTLM